MAPSRPSTRLICAPTRTPLRVVEVAAVAGAGGAFFVALGQRAGRIAPGDQPGEAGEVGVVAEHAAQAAALFFDLEQFDDAGLARVGQRFQRVDVTAAQCAVFLVEQAGEFAQARRFPRRAIARGCHESGPHPRGYAPELLVRGDRGEQVDFEAQHLVGDALRIDVIAAIVHRRGARRRHGSRSPPAACRCGFRGRRGCARYRRRRCSRQYRWSRPSCLPRWRRGRARRGHRHRPAPDVRQFH